MSNTKNGQNSHKSLVFGILATILIITGGIYALTLMKNINLETIILQNVIQQDPCEKLFNEMMDIREKYEELLAKGKIGVYSQEEFEKRAQDLFLVDDKRQKEILQQIIDHKCKDRLDEWVTDDITKELTILMKNYGG